MNALERLRQIARHDMTERETDEMHLEWLRLVDARISFQEVGRRFGVSRSTVAGIVRRIRLAEVG